LMSSTLALLIIGKVKGELNIGDFSGKASDEAIYLDKCR